MLSSFFPFINKYFFYERVEQMEPNKVANFVYRENLSKKLSANKQKKTQFLAQEKGGKNLKRTNHANRTAEEKSDVIRIKVKMTKEEAVRLLSKCKEGGVLGFKDVAQELAQIPVNRVSVVSYNTSRCEAVLKSIPEEL